MRADLHVSIQRWCGGHSHGDTEQRLYVCWLDRGLQWIGNDLYINDEQLEVGDGHLQYRWASDGSAHTDIAREWRDGSDADADVAMVGWRGNLLASQYQPREYGWDCAHVSLLVAIADKLHGA